MRLRRAALGTMLALAALSPGCGPRERAQNPPAAEVDVRTPAPSTTEGDRSAGDELRLQSPLMRPDDLLPAEYTCDGADRSPPLQWTGLPPGTGSLALVMKDPDAPGGSFVHWVLYNISPSLDGLPEGGPPAGSVVEGVNDFGRLGYAGPCPPAGDEPHHYEFNLFALDRSHIDLPAGASESDLVTATQGRVLASASLTLRYGR